MLSLHYDTSYIVLHPCHKLEYFRRNNWDEELVEAVHNIVQDEFDRTYWLLDVEGDDGTTQANRNVAVSSSYSFGNTSSLMTLYTGFYIF